MRNLWIATVAGFIAATGSAAAQPGLPTATAAPAPVAVATQARANLNISPKRVTLDRNHRSASVYIFNQGSAAATFDISLVDRVMLPDGQILALADAQSDPLAAPVAARMKSAGAFLQVSPRRVTLTPGQGQTIRLRIAAAPDDASLIEVRSHLTIATIPPRDSGTTAEAAAAATTPNELRFTISALFGLSIPAIVRLGAADVKAGIENASITYPDSKAAPEAPPVVNLDLVRLGANSLFGVVEVRSRGQARNTPPLGVARGVGVYPEIGRRTMHIGLNRPLAPGEHVEVTFTDDDTSPGKLLAKLAL